MGRRLQCRGTAAILTCVRTRPVTDRWTSRSGRVRRRTRSHASGSRSQAIGVKGNQRLEAVGHGPARTLRRRGGWRAVGDAVRPAERPACWRCSRARLIRFSAGQPYFDCVFLLKFQLCDKNGRYESFR
jgi:hypothetical protein